MEILKTGYKVLKRYPSLDSGIKVGDVLLRKEDERGSGYSLLSDELNFVFKSYCAEYYNPKDFPEFFKEVKVKITID